MGLVNTMVILETITHQ